MNLAPAHNPDLPLYFIDFAPGTTGATFNDEFLRSIHAQRIQNLAELEALEVDVNLIVVGHGNGNGFQVANDNRVVQLDYSHPQNLNWRANVQLVHLFTCYGANFMSSTEGFRGYAFATLSVTNARGLMLNLFRH
eukprot:NODE_156_length_16689_cov_0.273960.p9 type:complete len:135 gc:universal NODE_156_length_16689_cov_0.273960:11671-12075(+)